MATTPSPRPNDTTPHRSPQTPASQHAIDTSTSSTSRLENEVRAHPHLSENKQTSPVAAAASRATSRTSALLGSPLSSPLQPSPTHGQPIGGIMNTLLTAPEPSATASQQSTLLTVSTASSSQMEEDEGAVLEQITEHVGHRERVVSDRTASGDTIRGDGDVRIDDDDEVDVEGEGEGDGEADDGEEDDEGEGEGEGEGDAEGEGSGSEDDEEDEEEEEDDEEDDSEDEGSEDLEGSPDIMAIDAPDGSVPTISIPLIKTEPGASGAEAGAAPTDPATATAAGEGETNLLVPKKKKRVRRSPSAEEDLAPPPPPMKTIRLEKAMLEEGLTLEWNILEDAREKGMVEIWGVTEEEVVIKGSGDGMELDEAGTAGPGPSSSAAAAAAAHAHTAVQNGAGEAAGLFGLGFGDEDAEEIARRLEEKYGEADKKKKKSKKKVVEIYDLEDPFIDDSDILIDAPTHFARPKKEGFFVHAGPLELMEESPAKARPRSNKPKAGRVTAPAPVSKPRRSLAAVLRSRRRVSSHGVGSQVAPISIDDSDNDDSHPPSQDEARVGPSRLKMDRAEGSLSPLPDGDDGDLIGEPEPIDRTRYKSASKDPRFLPPFAHFPREVRDRLNALRAASNEHNWNKTEKGKFPEHLKAFLQRVGEAAYQHGVFGLSDREGADKGFTPALPSVLPYNEFTLKKLVTKLCYSNYWRWLNDLEEEGLRQIKEMVEVDKESVMEKYEASFAQWQEEAREYDEKHPPAMNGVAGEHDSPHLGTNGDLAPTSTPKLDDARPAEPPKRFTWTNEMREVFGQLLDNLQDTVDLTKKATEWSIPGAKIGKEMSEVNLKSRLYKKIGDCFPEGYMNGTIISREKEKVTRKKKQQGQADQDE